MDQPFFHTDTALELMFTFCLFAGESVSAATSYSLFSRRDSGGRYFFTSCSFAIKVKADGNHYIIIFPSNGYQGNTGCRLTYCRVDIDFSEALNCRMYIVPQNSYFTGTLSSDNSIYILGYSGMDTCYYSIFEIVGSGLIITQDSASGATANITSILINEDLFTGTIPYGLTNVSSSDLSDAQKLRDTYGFLIQT
jgi:hypothetical protein